MLDQKFITEALNRSAKARWTGVSRSGPRTAGIAGIGGAAILPAAFPASAARDAKKPAGAPSDWRSRTLLNLEYREAESYLRAVTGRGLTDGLTGGKGQPVGIG